MSRRNVTASIADEVSLGLRREHHRRPERGQPGSSGSAPKTRSRENVVIFQAGETLVVGPAPTPSGKGGAMQ